MHASRLETSPSFPVSLRKRVRQQWDRVVQWAYPHLPKTPFAVLLQKTIEAGGNPLSEVREACNAGIRPQSAMAAVLAAWDAPNVDPFLACEAALFCLLRIMTYRDGGMAWRMAVQTTCQKSGLDPLSIVMAAPDAVDVSAIVTWMGIPPERARWVTSPCQGVRSLSLEHPHDQEVRQLPRGLVIPGSLWARRHVQLNAIGHGLRVMDDVQLGGCVRLTSLPDGLSAHSVDLGGCASFKRLPAGLAIRCGIDLRGCVAWDGIIPDDARVMGTIIGSDGIPVVMRKP